MKTKDISKSHAFDPAAFDSWLKHSGHRFKAGLTGLTVDDNVDVGKLASEFGDHVAQERDRIAQEREDLARRRSAAERSAAVKQQMLDGMLISSGFNFEGFSITKYSGYISGDDAVSMDRPTHGWLGGVNTSVGADLLAGLAHIRHNALAALKEQAYALGCNAVIGVDFDYLTLDPETATNQGGTLYLPFLFAVTANGNAVVIEPKTPTE